MHKISWAILALLLSYGGLASAATLLPNGKQQFFDTNGRPLAGGSVTFYIPSTSTPKTTWRDAAQTTANTNPLALDASGSAIIYGAGCYRQLLKDSSGGTIWDQPTCDTSSTNLIWAGTSSGTVNSQSLTAPNFTAADGQTVSFVAGLSNTGALGLIINGGSSINVLRDTVSGTFSLAGGEVVAGNNVQVVYVGGAFHLVNNPVASSNPLSTLAASGTTDLGSVPSRLVKVTGSSSITSFGSSASLAFPFYQVTFEGNVTLVSSSSMTLPGGSNMSISANDLIGALYLGLGNWQVFSLSSGGGIAGEIRAFAMATCPSGFLEAAGQSVASVTYPNLFVALGTTWGTSSGNVVLPDARGRFARGFDHGAGNDPGRVFGTNQGDQLQDHQHTIDLEQGTVLTGATGTTQGTVGTENTSNPVTGNHGAETRPKNFTVTYCVKY